jgi:hypothetical protein
VRHARAALVEPLAPEGGPSRPFAGADAALLRDPTRLFAKDRRRFGDTFVADVFAFRLVGVFSPAGVRRLYEVPENQASVGLSTSGSSASRSRRSSSPGGETVPITSSARNGSRATSSARLRVVGRHRSRLPPRPSSVSSSVSSSSSTGLTAARRSSARPARSEPGRLAPPANAGPCGASRPSSPRSGLVGRRRDRPWRLPRTARRFLDDQSPDEAVIGAARDVIMLHVGAPSKLYAALAWTLVHVLTEPGVLERVRSGDDAFLERCASESIRLAQRSSRGARS